MSTAKRHHIVPQFYLRGFSESGQIGTILLPGERRFSQSVRRAASETGFYAIEGHPEGADVFERALSNVESGAATALDSIGSGVWPLPTEQRGALAYFIAIQAVRGPEQRRNMEYIAAQGARLELKLGGRDSVDGWVERNGGPPVSREQADQIWAEATRPEGPPIQVAPLAHIEQMVRLSEELLPYIAGRPWSLVRFARRSLITSDAPVTLVPDPETAPWMGVGFLTAAGITFPLTRRLGLLMADPSQLAAAKIPLERVFEGSFDSVLPASTSVADFFNHHTVASASQWLYHHPDDGAVVPSNLPAARPRTITSSGGV